VKPPVAQELLLGASRGATSVAVLVLGSWSSTADFALRGSDRWDPVRPPRVEQGASNDRM